MSADGLEVTVLLRLQWPYLLDVGGFSICVYAPADGFATMVAAMCEMLEAAGVKDDKVRTEEFSGY